MEDLWRLSAAELAGLIRSKKVSAKEAATAEARSATLAAYKAQVARVPDHRVVLAENARHFEAGLIVHHVGVHWRAVEVALHRARTAGD